MIKIVHLICFEVIFLTGCSKDTVKDQPSLHDPYQYAVSDAIVADSSEACDTLCPILAGNSKLEWETINNEQYVMAGNFTKYPDSFSGTLLVNSWSIL